MQGVVNFFGRISILIDQNTQAFHMFMSALLQVLFDSSKSLLVSPFVLEPRRLRSLVMCSFLQLFDRSGLLYGELARFVLRLLGIKTRTRKHPQLGPGALPGLDGDRQQYIEGPTAASGSWDNVWGDDVKEAS